MSIGRRIVILDATKLRVVAAEVEQQADRQLPVVEIGPQLDGVFVFEAKPDLNKARVIKRIPPAVSPQPVLNPAHLA